MNYEYRTFAAARQYYMSIVVRKKTYFPLKSKYTVCACSKMTLSTRSPNKRQELRNDFTFRSGSTVVIKNVYPPPMMEHQTGE